MVIEGNAKALCNIICLIQVWGCCGGSNVGNVGIGCSLGCGVIRGDIV